MSLHRFATSVATSLVLLCALSSIGCHSYPTRAIPTQAVSMLPARQASGQVTIAADPCETAQQCKDVFNYPMTDSGFLPILLVVQNDSAESLTLLRSKIELTSSTGDRLEPVEAAVAASEFGRNALAEAVWLFGVFSYDDAKKFNEEMIRDWTEKGMKEVQVVNAGRISRKYLYFKTGKAGLAGSRLSVRTESEDSHQRQTFVIPFK